MALDKEHGVNPVAGGLPMLLQMPVWLVRGHSSDPGLGITAAHPPQ